MERLNIKKASFSDVAEVVDCVNAAYKKYIDRIGKKPGPMLDDYALLIDEGNVR